MYPAECDGAPVSGTTRGCFRAYWSAREQLLRSARTIYVVGKLSQCSQNTRLHMQSQGLYPCKLNKLPISAEILHGDVKPLAPHTAYNSFQTTRATLYNKLGHRIISKGIVCKYPGPWALSTVDCPILCLQSIVP